ncbi:hypothetical protein [Clostridium estertheticum]|uniref:hypothetical protein n=1 Tax=Clostridium estertheticum TaxID=238834 RepID=UPI001C0B219B|nr:hypothetical protein [Clostridium estertheticum]MBU3186898.1 hypothetical protein [Clostridium estertheticum]
MEIDDANKKGFAYAEELDYVEDTQGVEFIEIWKLKKVYSKCQNLLMVYYKDQKSVSKENLSKYQEMKYMINDDELFKKMFLRY